MMEFWKAIQSDFLLSLPIVCILLTAQFLDFLFGVGVAWTRNTISSSIGKIGVMRKSAMLATVLGFAIADGIFPNLALTLPLVGRLQFTFAAGMALYWISCEAISIAENLALMGLPIRKSWIKKLKKVQEIFDGEKESS